MSVASADSSGYLARLVSIVGVSLAQLVRTPTHSRRAEAGRFWARRSLGLTVLAAGLILTLMLCQQQVVVLDNRVLQCPLNFGDQATFAVKALMRGCIGLGLVDQPIQWIVPIGATLCYLCGSHLLAPDLQGLSA